MPRDRPHRVRSKAAESATIIRFNSVIHTVFSFKRARLHLHSPSMPDCTPAQLTWTTTHSPGTFRLCTARSSHSWWHFAGTPSFWLSDISEDHIELGTFIMNERLLVLLMGTFSLPNTV
jgi:hypothetical protein